jgi:cysteine synthase
MAGGKGPDWSKTGTVAGYAEWLRSKSDALCVVVIRPFNSVLAADPMLTPADCSKRLDEELPGLLEALTRSRDQGNKGTRGNAARVEHGPCPM